MRILHYSLGFPPYRSGGLTKFCVDLMEEQIKEEHNVALIWPGEMQYFSSKTKIQKDKDFHGIKSYEIINPTPVSYDEGILDIKPFMNFGDKNVYLDFLKNIRPDVIHIHTFMGLHKNLLIAAKEQGIRLVFTTHDFFPICPKVTMFRNNEVCEEFDCKRCPTCNSTAISLRKIQILQSPLYRKFKDSSIVRKLRKQHRDDFLEETSDNKVLKDIKTSSEGYLKLRRHYRSMFELMDFIHYNSLITKKVYDAYFGEHLGKIITITHSDIQDNRKEKQFGAKIRITYLGNQGGAKGFFV